MTQIRGGVSVYKYLPSHAGVSYKKNKKWFETNIATVHLDLLGTIHKSRFIAEIKNLKTIRVGQKTQKYRKNSTPIPPPEITILKTRPRTFHPGS